MIEIDTPKLDALLGALVRIDSVNPTLDARHSGEAEIATFTAATLRDLGMAVEVVESTPGRPSVIGTLAGSGGGRSLMLNAHYDTVDVAGMENPFSGEVRDGRLHGRGSYDMKGSLAACIAAVEAIVRSGQHPRGDIVITAVADEEVASIGMMDVLQRCQTDGAIVTEPTSLRLCLAHKGFVWYEVTTHGRAAHGSRPELGIDANAHMGRVLAGIETLGRSLAEGRRHPLVGHGSLHAATLAGGSGMSTYAAECRLGIERRTIPGETEAAATAQIQAILDPLHAADPAFRADLRVTLAREPFEAAPASALAEALARAAQPVLGDVPRVGDTPWMDAALARADGIDTIVFGPHGEGAHAAVEWVDLASVHRCALVLALTALDYCA